MENTIEKKNNSSNVLLIIVIILILLLGGFIVYDKFLKKEESTNCPKCEEKECQKEECNCSSNNSVTTTTTTNSYQTFSKNLKKEITSSSTKSFLAKDGYWTDYSDNKENDVTYKTILNNKMELIMVFDEYNSAYKQKFGEIKIATNVISFNIAQAGPGAYQNVYFIKEDGTVGEAIPWDLFGDDAKSKITVNYPIKGLKNIVSIVQGSFDNVGSTQDPYAIDINGNSYVIASYWD